jgi:hypothetical protein
MKIEENQEVEESETGDRGTLLEAHKAENAEFRAALPKEFRDLRALEVEAAVLGRAFRCLRCGRPQADSIVALGIFDAEGKPHSESLLICDLCFERKAKYLTKLARIRRRGGRLKGLHGSVRIDGGKT